MSLTPTTRAEETHRIEKLLQISITVRENFFVRDDLQVFDGENESLRRSSAPINVYDATGLRVRKISGSTTESVYSGSQVIAQYGNAQSLLAEYVFAGDQQVAVLATGPSRKETPTSDQCARPHHASYRRSRWTWLCDDLWFRRT